MCNRKTSEGNGAIWMKLHDRERLRRQMRMKNLSARQLATRAGWKSHTYLGRLLRGEADTLETDPALRIAFELGVPVDDLFLTNVSRKTDADTSKAGTGQKVAA